MLTTRALSCRLFPALAVAGAIVMLGFQQSHRVLRASLTDDAVLVLADANHDGRLSLKEIRKGITAGIMAIAVQNTAYDLDHNGIVDRNDLRLLIQSLHAFLSAVCGNGIKDVGEQCDDGNAVAGDGCSSVCAVEPGFTCSGSPSACKTLLAKNLEAYWKLDEAGGTRKASVGGHDLGVWNADIGSAPGKIGTALAPNIYYGLSTAAPSLANANRSFSVAAWVYFDTGIFTTNDAFVIADGVSTSGEWTWMLSYRFLNADRFNFSLNNGVAPESVESVTFGRVNKGDWNLVVASYDAVTKKMSVGVNGGIADTAFFSGTPKSAGSSLSVGFDSYRIWGGVTRAGYIGRIDELGIWGRVLTQADAVDLYNSGLGQTVPFLSTVCGDGVVSPDQPCDDGNQINTDSCTNACTLPRCGDGFKQGTEQCDDGNTTDADGCSNLCKLPICGDSIVQSGEQCDDGNQATGDVCPKNCRNAFCGDGFILSGVEQCDDGNTTSGDGCSSSCVFEPMTQSLCLQNPNKLWDSAKGCIDKTQCYEYKDRASCPDTMPSTGKRCVYDTTQAYGFYCKEDFTKMWFQVAPAPVGCSQLTAASCGGGSSVDGGLCVWNGTQCQKASYPDRCVGTSYAACVANDLCQAGKLKSDLTGRYTGPTYCYEKNTCESIKTQTFCSGPLRANILGTSCLWDPHYERDYSGNIQPKCLNTISASNCIHYSDDESACITGKKGNYYCLYDAADHICRIDHQKSGTCTAVNTNFAPVDRQSRCIANIGCAWNADTQSCQNQDPTIVPPPAVCGNGVVEDGEQCDTFGESETCMANCQTRIQTCGDGYVQGTEECDDANQYNDDNCSNTCTRPRCGDGVRQGDYEQCDDGNQDLTDDCTICRQAYCGDGFVNRSTEECDLGARNGISGSMCTADCRSLIQIINY